MNVSRFWGWTERFVLVMVLMFMMGFLVVIANETFPTLSQESTEAFSLGFNAISLLISVLLASALSGAGVNIVQQAVRRPLGDHGEWVVNCVFGLGAAAFVVYNMLSMDTPYSLHPEFATVQYFLGGAFVLGFVAKARPVRTLLVVADYYQTREQEAAA